MTANPTFRPRSVVLTLAAVSLVATGISLPPDRALGAAPESAALGPSPLRGPDPVPAQLDYGPVPVPVAPEPEQTQAEREPEVRRNGVAAALPLGSADLRETRTARTVAKGVTLTVIRRGGKGHGGPWVVRALTIDPKVAKGHLATAYGTSLARATPTTRLTERADALVGVNASFFAIGSRLPGNPVGLTVAEGRVLSEPSGMSREVTLLVDTARNALRIGRLNWAGRLEEGRKTLWLNKVNAIPRVPAACRTPASQAHCTHHGQIAAFTTEFGARTPSGVGTEVLLDRHGCAVQVLSHRGARLTHGRTSIQATGAAARSVRKLAKRGCLNIRHTVRDADGKTVGLSRSIAAVSGRFQLLDEGRNVAPKRTGAFFRRHPRTLAGTTWDGKIVLATIDGRSGRSVGATLREAGAVAWALGLRDAINLDGGGSTTMSIRGKLANNVSGRSERAVSDALVWRRAN